MARTYRLFIHGRTFKQSFAQTEELRPELEGRKWANYGLPAFILQI